MKNKFAVIYITVATKREAQRIARALLRERWAAGVNLVGPISSSYWWQGRIEQSQEWLLLAKTRTALLGPLISCVKALHSYKVPCIVALPITRGNPEFFRWIERETAAWRPNPAPARSRKRA
ncbi:MAG: divalent-cation tolerance protein CutA [Kiritimatiellaeota bacterium]|nr:divalent-cation tolerance protein CutA [Kiritimatiellota bacterium]